MQLGVAQWVEEPSGKLGPLTFSIQRKSSSSVDGNRQTYSSSRRQNSIATNGQIFNMDKTASLEEIKKARAVIHPEVLPELPRYDASEMTLSKEELEEFYRS